MFSSYKLFGRKLIDGSLTIHLSRPQRHRRELRLVRRIGKSLGFQAEPASVLIGDAVFPFRRSVKEVAGVELKPRLIGEDGHHAPAADFIQLRDLAHTAGAAFQDPVVIVALAKRQLLIRRR